LGDRPAAVCRELTKLHEEIRRDGLAALARDYAAGAETRGELVLVIAPPLALAAAPEAIDDLLRAALRTQTLRDAVGAVAAATGEPRGEVYRRALALAKEPQ
jgi:16S rRNA (cytidine1402-2'-O)-methyltransferase